MTWVMFLEKCEAFINTHKAGFLYASRFLVLLENMSVSGGPGFMFAEYKVG